MLITIKQCTGFIPLYKEDYQKDNMIYEHLPLAIVSVLLWLYIAYNPQPVPPINYTFFYYLLRGSLILDIR